MSHSSTLLSLSLTHTFDATSSSLLLFYSHVDSLPLNQSTICRIHGQKYSFLTYSFLGLNNKPDQLPSSLYGEDYVDYLHNILKYPKLLTSHNKQNSKRFKRYNTKETKRSNFFFLLSI